MCAQEPGSWSSRSSVRSSTRVLVPIRGVVMPSRLRVEQERLQVAEAPLDLGGQGPLARRDRPQTGRRAVPLRQFGELRLVLQDVLDETGRPPAQQAEDDE